MSGPRRSAPPIVIVGAGAAGIMAALFAAGEGRRVVLLERTKDGGRKILISGGGRCNVLPSRVHPSQFVTASSHNTLTKILSSWPLPDQRRFFEDVLGIRLVLEEETGKLFPASNRAREVRDVLLDTARMRGVEICFEACVADLRPPAQSQPWQVILNDGEIIAASAVVIASGGLSVPATGSDGIGIRIVKQLGHTIHETYPALTPLTADPPRHAHLAGISLDVTLVAPVGKRRLETHGGFLFTHRGYSGPSVLDLSHLAVRSRGKGAQRQPIFVQWTEQDASTWDHTLREGGAGTVATLLRRHLPARLADTLLAEAAVDMQRTLAELRRDERARLVELLARYPLPWTGDEGYKKAEVTGGGVSLAEIDPVTLESRLSPGLFLCGEILDAFGPIGGYNFLWGWATGRAAGMGAAAHVNRR
jgi:predicted Rossmann fold flavoprotein